MQRSASSRSPKRYPTTRRQGCRAECKSGTFVYTCVPRPCRLFVDVPSLPRVFGEEIVEACDILSYTPKKEKSPPKKRNAALLTPTKPKYYCSRDEMYLFQGRGLRMYLFQGRGLRMYLFQGRGLRMYLFQGQGLRMYLFQGRGLRMYLFQGRGLRMYLFQGRGLVGSGWDSEDNTGTNSTDQGALASTGGRWRPPTIRLLS